MASLIGEYKRKDKISDEHEELTTEATKIKADHYIPVLSTSEFVLIDFAPNVITSTSLVNHS